MSKKSYCTQNGGDCRTCSLVNYGLDCANNPVAGMAPVASMARKGTKMDRAMATYDGFKGSQTVSHIRRLIGDDLAARLTGRELGLVMSAVNRAWHEAKKTAGAEVDGDYVWIDALDAGYDLDVLQRLVKHEERVCERRYYDGNLADVMQDRYMTHDDMPYEEQRRVYEMRHVPRSEWSKWYCKRYVTKTWWELADA